MKKIPINPDPQAFPPEFQQRLRGRIFDSSCSPQASVYFLEEQGLYLKRSPKGTLRTEAELTRYFHQKGFGTQVLEYLSLEEDWLLTAAVSGEDATDPRTLAEPKKLCKIYGEALRTLHETSARDCPVPNRTATYLATARENFQKGLFDPSYFMDISFENPAEAWQFAEKNAAHLQADTLIHGDYCLPNIILRDGKFHKFIDLGNGGLADRHIDLYWGVWSLQFNLKTDQYRGYFLDCYGRDRVEEEMLRVIGALECFG